MTPAQKKYYERVKHDPDYMARRRAAVKRYSLKKKALAQERGVQPVEPAVGERFEDWLRRWAESEGRALFAARAAAMHQRMQRESEARKARAAAAFERLRLRPLRQGKPVSSSKVSATAPSSVPRVNSVFALGQMAAGHVSEAKPLPPHHASSDAGNRPKTSPALPCAP